MANNPLAIQAQTEQDVHFIDDKVDVYGESTPSKLNSPPTTFTSRA